MHLAGSTDQHFALAGMQNTSGLMPIFLAYSFVCTALSVGNTGLHHRTVHSATHNMEFRYAYRAARTGRRRAA